MSSGGKLNVKPEASSARVTANSVPCIRMADTSVAPVKIMTSTSITFSRIR